jgi:hypothetical protein
MIGLLVFNAIMVLLAAGIGSQVIPARLYQGLLVMLHNTVGITTPPPNKEWLVALIWIATVTVIVDGMLLLLVFLAAKVI